MNVEQINEWIEAGDLAAVESAWLDVMTEDPEPEQVAAVLEALNAADQLDMSEMLGVMLLEERASGLPPERTTALTRAMVSAVPESDELRSRAAEAMRTVHGEHPHFDALLEASGLNTGQSPKRAFRTLNTCLGAAPGSYLWNRFDHRVLKTVEYNDILGEFSLTDPIGREVSFEPKNLADEFELVEDTDFRVLCTHRTDQLGDLLDGDPAAVLIGLCRSRGGQIDADDLKDALVPRYMDATKWSRWWNKARTAAKRCEQLTLEGRPIVVTFHPGGLSLEEELASEADAAVMPIERLELLRKYARELRQRKLEADADFAAGLLNALAEQVRSFRANRPTDALTAALALEEAKELGFDAASRDYPSPAEVFADADDPAAVVAELPDESLWPEALAALEQREDAARHLAALLPHAPAGQLDELTARCAAAGCGEAVDEFVTTASLAPTDNLDAWVWLWKGPASPPAAMPKRAELLSRMLNALQEIQREWDFDKDRRKEIYQTVRNALSASDYAGFRETMDEMDEGVAGPIKRLVERCDGLAEAVRGDLLEMLREEFYGLFVEKKVDPWLDETTIYTTEAALERYRAELQELVDVKMLENSRAIGAAAEHGDLSENSEWKFAIEEQKMLQARAAKMQEEIAMARGINPDQVDTDRVAIGAQVTLKRDDGQVRVLSFLGPWDSDPHNGVYSYQTRLGKSLMGLHIGDAAVLSFEGEDRKYTVESIASAL